MDMVWSAAFHLFQLSTSKIVTECGILDCYETIDLAERPIRATEAGP